LLAKSRLTEGQSSTETAVYTNNRIMKYVLKIIKATFDLGKIRKTRKKRRKDM